MRVENCCDFCNPLHNGGQVLETKLPKQESIILDMITDSNWTEWSTIQEVKIMTLSYDTSVERLQGFS